MRYICPVNYVAITNGLRPMFYCADPGLIFYEWSYGDSLRNRLGQARARNIFIAPE